MELGQNAPQFRGFGFPCHHLGHSVCIWQSWGCAFVPPTPQSYRWPRSGKVSFCSQRTYFTRSVLGHSIDSKMGWIQDILDISAISRCRTGADSRVTASPRNQEKPLPNWRNIKEGGAMFNRYQTAMATVRPATKVDRSGSVSNSDLTCQPCILEEHTTRVCWLLLLWMIFVVLERVRRWVMIVKFRFEVKEARWICLK